MIQFTEEQRKALIERCKMISTWREKYGDYANVMLPAVEAKELAEISLAALTAEPVAFDIQDSDARSRGETGFLRRFANISKEDIAEYEINITPLYTDPPVAALRLPDEVIEKIIPSINPEGLDEEIHYIEHAIYLDRERIRKELREYFNAATPEEGQE